MFPMSAHLWSTFMVEEELYEHGYLFMVLGYTISENWFWIYIYDM